MNTEYFFKNNYLINFINANDNIKQKNIKIINSFKTLYDIIGFYYDADKNLIDENIVGKNEEKNDISSRRK